MASSRRSSSSSESGSQVTSHTASQQRDRSPTHTIEGTSIAETNSLRSASPTPSHNLTSSVNHTVSQQQTTAIGGIPVIRPPVIPPTTGSGINHFGPQHPTQTPIRIDVNAAQQQYQQHPGPAQMSSYTGSTSSSTGASQSSPGSASIQQSHTAPTSNVTSHPHVQPRPVPPAAQFPNQIPAQHVYNELLGPDAFKDVILDIDYGALGSLNVPFQSPGDFAGGQLPPGINVRPAYTTVDSLNYQQHMFNTSRTIYGDGGAGAGFDQQYDYANANQGQYNYGASGQFDAAKAIFNQVDTNHDGRISRDEFQQWAQGGQTGAYAYASQSQTNFNQATVLEGNSPAVATILQQSGLSQALHR